MAQEDRIVQLEQCDCKMSCKANDGETKQDGDRWEEDCNTCRCEKGVKSCHKKHCNKVNCKYPVFPKDDKCCPKCLSELSFYFNLFFTSFQFSCAYFVYS